MREHERAPVNRGPIHANFAAFVTDTRAFLGYRRIGWRRAPPTRGTDARGAGAAAGGRSLDLPDGRRLDVRLEELERPVDDSEALVAREAERVRDRRTADDPVRADHRADRRQGRNERGRDAGALDLPRQRCPATRARPSGP